MYSFRTHFPRGSIYITPTLWPRGKFSLLVAYYPNSNNKQTRFSTIPNTCRLQENHITNKSGANHTWIASTHMQAARNTHTLTHPPTHQWMAAAWMTGLKSRAFTLPTYLHTDGRTQARTPMVRDIGQAHLPLPTNVSIHRRAEASMQAHNNKFKVLTSLCCALSCKKYALTGWLKCRHVYGSVCVCVVRAKCVCVWRWFVVLCLLASIMNIVEMQCNDSSNKNKNRNRNNNINSNKNFIQKSH